MAVLNYYPGFTVGSSTWTITIGSTATLTAGGRFCHYDLTPITDPTGLTVYSVFATAVQSAITSQIGAGYTVSFSTVTNLYTISKAGNFTMSLGANLAAAMGFTTASHTGTDSYSSDVRPYYMMVPQITARSSFSQNYEPDDLGEEAVTDGGIAYVASRTTSELRCDWVQAMETKAATFSRNGTAAIPWTWQHFFAHTRGTHPFLVQGDDTVYSKGLVYRLRKDGVFFKPEAVATDYDGLWMIPLRARDLGGIP